MAILPSAVGGKEPLIAKIFFRITLPIVFIPLLLWVIAAVISTIWSQLAN